MSEAVTAAWQALGALEKPTLQALFADPARLDCVVGQARSAGRGGAV
jgi:hypothetical protein